MAKKRTIRRNDSTQVEMPATVSAQTTVEETDHSQPAEVLCGLQNDCPETFNDAAIKELAHCKWEAAGCPSGDGIEFWLAAESEILKKAGDEPNREVIPGI